MSSETLIAKIFFTIGLALFASGCAPSSRPKDWSGANVHKVVVVCAQGDRDSNRRIEELMIPRLRKQGFEAISTQELFFKNQKSPKELLRTAQKAHIDGIMEVVYSGKPPLEGPPQGIRFKYYSIKGQPEGSSDRKSSLDAALAELIADLNKPGHHQIEVKRKGIK